jgi:pimeloyl-ACP methyl ester carboxylesterase
MDQPSFQVPAGDIPIIMLSGMAADERLFESQLSAFPNLRVQRWIDPRPGESLQQYAARLALLVNPGCPCILGGASFGGVVALEMAQHVPALACILIGSIRSPSGLPWRWRILWPLALVGPHKLQALVRLIVRFGKLFLTRQSERRLQRMSRPESSFVAWATCAVICWRPSPSVGRIPVFHIHGSADEVLPVAICQPDVIVPDGLHALTLFNASAVNEFIRVVVTRVSR